MIELLRKRRSIRVYEDRKIEPEKIEILKEALLRSPSSRNRNPWEFIFVDKKELLKELSKSKEHGSEFLEDAALGIIVCGDEKQSDVWIEDCSIASILVQTVAQSMDMGSCWIQIRNRMHNKNTSSEAYIQDLFNIPKNMKVESVISIGYPAEKKAGVPKEKLQLNKIKMNCW
ncbi:Oxygen-insensitive NAD(P)H nitroreductase [Candidatus Brocadiaceae bacterium B188]|nr:nitroreductase family protein [Candidatus Brocadia sapporoensis]MEB2309034.1 nitroreductase family protein [Candidatus Brocadiaceae bacterium]RZV57045.1 MAG: NAD(P)H-dependent dehydrogenase/reductase [Candidatus Brocadia sp. BROELEC01]TWU53466.1 Oxygen-insensitive NAD(P)H nitroreductase [Candidatus Brocadiaceae bacterium B188]